LPPPLLAHTLSSLLCLSLVRLAGSCALCGLQLYGEHKLDVMGIAYRHIRSGSKGGPKSRQLFPCVGFRNGGENGVTIRNCKWLSRPGEPASAALDRVLEVRAHDSVCV
jgi:hypothetical protein